MPAQGELSFRLLSQAVASFGARAQVTSVFSPAAPVALANHL
ncbi:hypothetical protein TSMEX_001200 [Taenia solium]|eukprot:TsM_000282100 transcript=TsM_000282100 gene=TsM_000282100